MFLRQLFLVFILLFCFVQTSHGEDKNPLPENSIKVGPIVFYFEKSDVFRPGVIEAGIMQRKTPCVIVLSSVHTVKGDTLRLAQLLQERIIVLPEDIHLEQNVRAYGPFVIRKTNVHKVKDKKDVVITLYQYN